MCVGFFLIKEPLTSKGEHRLSIPVHFQASEDESNYLNNTN